MRSSLNQGRTINTKKALYRAIAAGLHDRVGLNRDDVMIALVEVPKENWSFGRGEAQYADWLQRQLRETVKLPVLWPVCR